MTAVYIGRFRGRRRFDYPGKQSVTAPYPERSR